MRCQMDKANADARDPAPDPIASTRLLHYPVSNFLGLQVVSMESGESTTMRVYVSELDLNAWRRMRSLPYGTTKIRCPEQIFVLDFLA